jgi:hypothetical protein
MSPECVPLTASADGSDAKAFHSAIAGYEKSDVRKPQTRHGAVIAYIVIIILTMTFNLILSGCGYDTVTK